MKDLSFFLFKNALGSRMRKGFKNFCHGDSSTSTLNQQHKHCDGRGEPEPSYVPTTTRNPYLADDDDDEAEEGQPTLEQMILQLELEERMARRRRGKVDEYGEIKHRMSCVNSSDILRTARNALNQYPRFSLDGKDAMYTSSFRNMPPSTTTGSRKSSCGSNEQLLFRKGIYAVDCFHSQVDRIRHLPTRLAGQSVFWCKPGVVAKLMGLDAMPIPLLHKNHHHFHHHGKERLNAIIQRQNLRRRAERHELERRLVLNATRCGGGTGRGSCSRSGECRVRKPVALEELANEEAGWPMRRFS